MMTVNTHKKFSDGHSVIFMGANDFEELRSDVCKDKADDSRYHYWLEEGGDGGFGGPLWMSSRNYEDEDESDGGGGRSKFTVTGHSSNCRHKAQRPRDGFLPDLLPPFPLLPLLLLLPVAEPEIFAGGGGSLIQATAAFPVMSSCLFLASSFPKSDSSAWVTQTAARRPSDGAVRVGTAAQQPAYGTQRGRNQGSPNRGKRCGRVMGGKRRGCQGLAQITQSRFSVSPGDNLHIMRHS